MSNDIENPHANIPPPTPKHPTSLSEADRIAKRTSMMEKMKNRVTTGVSNWKENADFRMKICNTCPDYAAPRCKLCGCFMVAKTKIPQAKCPAGKW